MKDPDQNQKGCVNQIAIFTHIFLAIVIITILRLSPLNLFKHTNNYTTVLITTGYECSVIINSFSKVT